jgi:hypothetical protein
MTITEETIITPLVQDMTVHTYRDRLYGAFTDEDIDLLVRQQVALKKMRSPEFYQHVLNEVGKKDGAEGIVFEKVWEGAIVGQDKFGRRWVVTGHHIGASFSVRSFLKQDRRGKVTQWLSNGQPTRNASVVCYYGGELRIPHPEVADADLICAVNVRAINSVRA